MSIDRVHMGIDLGGMEPTAMYLGDGQARDLPVPQEARGPSVLFDPYGNVTSLGVGFPSLLQFLGSVALLDRCTAAALGQRFPRDEAKTVLVVDLAYGDCEVAVLRLARDRCRTLASAVLPGVSGEVLDAILMEAMVLGLRGRKIY